MKHIKAILFIFLSIILFSFNNIQDTNPFIGTWHYQNGNEVFEVIIWEDGEDLLGHYRLFTIDSSGNQVNEIFNSNKELGTSGVNWPYVLLASNNNHSLMGGPLTDNTVSNPPNGQFIDGAFSMEVQQDCKTCPINVIWKVKRPQGVSVGDISDFSIPTDCILVKVN